MITNWSFTYFFGQDCVGMYSSSDEKYNSHDNGSFTSETVVSSESGESDDEDDVHWMAKQIEREICIEDAAAADNVDTVSFCMTSNFWH